MRRLRIATRKSPLALWQAHHIGELIRHAHPEVEVELLELSTEGDRTLGAPLSAVGGKGLFVKEIEQALLDGRAEVAVHSLKDMTSTIPEGLMIAATPAREDARDVFVGLSAPRLEALPHGARIGTSSLRRSCQLLALRPDLEVVSLRGNVQSRLRKTEELGLSGTVLAYAGLKRLELSGRATQLLEPELCLPAVGQGVLAVECRREDAQTRELLGSLDDATTRTVVDAERAFLAQLEGGCSVPLAAYAVVEGGSVWIRGLVGTPDGKQLVRGERRGGTSEAAALGAELAGELYGRGGREILEAVRQGAVGSKPS
jgi:hydroxymethylbilane synthase